jgi:hypothetical protein
MLNMTAKAEIRGRISLNPLPLREDTCGSIYAEAWAVAVRFPRAVSCATTLMAQRGNVTKVELTSVAWRADFYRSKK